MGILEDIEKRKREHIRKTGESTLEECIYCPYCACPIDMSDCVEYVSYERWSEVECDLCDKYFLAQMHARYSSRKGP